MKNLKNKKGFTLVELLAVIVVLAIVMGIAAIAITNVLESTRKNAFVASAKMYIQGARAMVNADEVTDFFGNDSTVIFSGNVAELSIDKIKTENEGKSPYDSKVYDSGSFVRITKNGTVGSYKYEIYLKDGSNHCIGAADDPKGENELAVGSCES